MSPDLTLAAARSDRDQLASRTDVLDKVGVLRTLSDDLHVTTDMVAEFYGVPVKTIQTIALRNGEELDSDGYRVVTRGAFEETFTMKVPSSASRIALFPRRAVLRVGMLLRDSDVAREVRDYLLNTEAASAVPFDPTMLTRLDILRLAINAEEELQAEKAKTAALEPRAEAYDNFLDATGKYSVGAVAKMLGSSQNKLFRDLRNAGVLIAKGSMRNTPYQPYMKYFEVRAHEYDRSNGETGCSYTTYVQPAGIDFIRRKLGLATIDPLPAAVSA